MSRAFALLGTTLLATTALAAEPDPRLAGYRTPPGWKVAIAATEPLVVNPVTMTFGPDGRLYVVEWKEGRGPNDHIKVLTDADGDGVFDKAEMYMEGLELPAGLLFWDGYTYITLDHDLVRFKDADGDGTFEVREAVVTGFGNDDSHHRVSGIVMGPDGYIYMTTGDSDAHAKGSDGTEATVLRCGGVFRCKPDGSMLENVAFGMRNPWGNVAFDDEFRMFHTDNDNEGAPGFTGCRLLHVVEGGDYGWRLREGARCCQPDFERATWNGGRPGRLGWMAETGRGAPAGLCVLNSSAFPPSTRNLLVYPDVFRKSVRAYKTRPVGATYAIGEEFELLASDEGLFRPTDAEIGPDGALYILDWRTDSGGAGQLSGNGKTGRIYRMTWSGTEKEPALATLDPDRLVELAKVEEDGLVAALCAEDYGTRRAASLELIRRGVERPGSLARLIADDQGPAASKRHALAVLSAVAPKRAIASWGEAARDDDPALRRLALEYARRFLPDDLGMPHFQEATASLTGIGEGRRKEDDAQALRERYLLLGKATILKSREGEKDPVTGKATRRVETLVVVTENAMRQNAALLLAEAARHPDADPFLRDAVTRGLEGLGPAGLRVVVETLSGDDPTLAAAAVYALQGWRSRDGVAALLDEATQLENHRRVATQVGLFRALRELGEAVPPERIADWLSKTKDAPFPVRAEAIRVLAAMGKRAILVANPLLPGLLAHENAEVRVAALELANVVRSDPARDALIALAKDADRPVEERRLALADLRGYDDKGLKALLVGLFAEGKDPGLRNEALRTLAPIDFAAAAGLARKALDDDDQELRQEAIALLGQKADTALEVVRRFDAGKLPKEDLARVIEAARTHATPELKAAVQELLRKNVLAQPGGPAAQKLRELVAKGGDPARGKALFLDAKKANCASCHRMEGVGTPIGPDLTRVWETLSADKRLESILEPSREIKEGYGTFKVATTDGRVLTGLLLSDTKDAVTLKDAQGREVRIPAAEVEQKANDPISLMPVGVVGHLGLGELADLLAFLGDRKAQESLKPAAAAAPK